MRRIGSQTPPATRAGKAFHPWAHHTVPAEIAYAIDNIHGSCTGVCQVTAVENQVGRGLLQVRQDRFKRRSISMDVG